MVQRSNGGGRSAVATRTRHDDRADRPSPRAPDRSAGPRAAEVRDHHPDAASGSTSPPASESVEALNQTLADTITLRDLYKKSHWQVAGHTFYQLHLLFDKHYEEQDELVDQIAERIQLLGGISLAMGADVAEETRIPRPPRGREEVPVQISRAARGPRADPEAGPRGGRRPPTRRATTAPTTCWSAT